MVSNIFLCSPRTLGKIPNLTSIFQRGWNHQPDILSKRYTHKEWIFLSTLGWTTWASPHCGHPEACHSSQVLRGELTAETSQVGVGVWLGGFGCYGLVGCGKGKGEIWKSQKPGDSSRDPFFCDGEKPWPWEKFFVTSNDKKSKGHFELL